MKQQKYNSNYPTEHGMTKGISTTRKKMLPAIFFSGVNEVFDIFVCYINSHLRSLAVSKWKYIAVIPAHWPKLMGKGADYFGNLASCLFL